MNLDKEVLNAQLEFDLCVSYTQTKLDDLQAEYQRKSSPAAIAERVEELADAALSALRACDRCTALELLRDAHHKK